MIQECENLIVEDDFHGFLHRNCEGTEQLRKTHIFLESRSGAVAVYHGMPVHRQIGEKDEYRSFSRWIKSGA